MFYYILICRIASRIIKNLSASIKDAWNLSVPSLHTKKSQCQKTYLAFSIVIRKALDSLLHVDCIDYSLRHW